MWDLGSLKQMAIFLAASVGKKLYYKSGDYRLRIWPNGRMDFRHGKKAIDETSAPYKGWSPTTKTLARLSRGRRW